MTTGVGTTPATACRSELAPCDVVIVSYNTCTWLRAALAEVSSARLGSIVVVDNDSSDGSTAMVRNEFPTVELIESATNVGYGAAANIGIGIGVSPFVAVLNADVRIDDETLRLLTTYLLDHPQVAIVGPRLFDVEGTEQASCAHWPSVGRVALNESGLWKLLAKAARTDWWQPFFVPPTSGPVDWVLGAALMIRRDALGGRAAFDPRYFLYFEEVDLCARLRSAGWQTHWCGEARANHVGGAATASVASSANLHYFRSFAEYQRRSRPHRRLLVERLVVTGLALAKGARAIGRRRDSAEIASWVSLLREAIRGWA